MIAEFRRRRDVITTGLNALPEITCLRPPGAFYAFPNVRKIDADTRRLQDFLLQEAGVSVLSGSAFGAHGEGYLRLSYANSVEAIREALERIRRAIARYAPQPGAPRR
jgi:aspartate/methionine/tyrosine aminotransferase